MDISGAMAELPCIASKQNPPPISLTPHKTGMATNNGCAILSISRPIIARF